ncbi:hypothetical protein VTN02DRAFT_5057 [Thermoascus thermophilus]
MGTMDDQNEFLDPRVVKSSLKVGALSGTAGLVYGGVSGVLRSPHPVIHSISCGIHWFACGTSFWWLRSNILRLHFQDNATPQERAYTSALSGGIAGGGVTKLMGGRFVPGIVVFSLLGYLGQRSYNALDRWRLENPDLSTRTIVQRIVDSRWVPLRSLSDEEYRHMLSEKQLGIEAEIAIIDEKIRELEKLKKGSNQASRSSSSGME